MFLQYFFLFSLLFLSFLLTFWPFFVFRRGAFCLRARVLNFYSHILKSFFALCFFVHLDIVCLDLSKLLFIDFWGFFIVRVWHVQQILHDLILRLAGNKFCLQSLLQIRISKYSKFLWINIIPIAVICVFVVLWHGLVVVNYIVKVVYFPLSEKWLLIKFLIYLE